MIRINEKYAIDSDTHCWQVKKYRGKDKEGKDKWESILFYRGLDSAVEGLTHLMVRESDYHDVTTLSQSLTRIIAEVKEAVLPWASSISEEK